MHLHSPCKGVLPPPWYVDVHYSFLKFFFFYPKQQGHMLHYLSDPRQNLTMFAPSILALQQLPDVERKYWTNSTERLQYLIRYCVYVHSLNTDLTLQIINYREHAQREQ